MSVLNGEATVSAAIESILGQTLADFEFIIIDDGSTDRSAEVIARHAAGDRRIRLVRQENRGLAAALNEGIRHARGTWIARMDADDACASDRFEKQMAVAAADPTLGVVGTGAWMRSRAGESLGVWLKPERHEALIREMYRDTPFIHPSVMMRRDAVVAAGGYREDLRRAQDAELWSRMASMCRFHNVQEPLVGYTIPERVSLQAVWDTARVRMIVGWRMGRPVAATRQALIGIAAKVLGRTGLYRSRTSRGRYQSS